VESGGLILGSCQEGEKDLLQEAKLSTPGSSVGAALDIELAEDVIEVFLYSTNSDK
jgi:hypothetical protein